MAFKGGLSFNLSDVIIPDEKDRSGRLANRQVDEVMDELQHGSHHQQRAVQPDH